MRLTEHRTTCARHVFLALVGSVFTVTATGAPNPAAGAVPLEVIVKFLGDSDAGRLIRQTLAENPTDLRALAAVEDQLHAATGFAMEVRGITSGAELLLAIPEQGLLEIVSDSTRTQPGVVSVRLMTADHENPNLPGSLLVLRFAPSSADAEIMRMAREDPGYADRVQAAATRLCGGAGVPVRGEAGPEAALIVTVDRPAFLAMLVERLDDLPFVEYAQPNTILQIMK